MKRDDFIFTIGYEGETAIVDGQAKRKYPGLTSTDLLDKGLYKAAFSAALFDGKDDEAEKILVRYNEETGSTYKSNEELKRLFGVFDVPEKINRIKVL